MATLARPQTAAAPRPTVGTLRLRYAMAVIVFRFALDLSYALYVSPAFEFYYVRSLILDFDLLRYGLSLFAVIPVLFFPHDKSDFRSIFLLSGTMFLYVPATSLYGLDETRTSFAMLMIIAAFVTAYAASSLSAPRAGRTAPAAAIERDVGGLQLNLAVILSLVGCFAFLVYSVVSGASEGIRFDLSDVYSDRDYQAELLDVGVASYFNLWTQKIFSPLLLIIGLHRRNWLLVGFAMAMQIYFFGVTQHRAHFLLPLIILMVMQLYERRITVATIIGLSAAFVIAILALSVALGLDQLPSIVIRRAFFVPASTAFDWVEFFYTEDFIMWSDRLLAWLYDSQYEGMDTTWWLGMQITGFELAYNSGMVGSGYANAGIPGVVFYGALLGLVASLVNSLVSRGMPMFLAAALLFGPFRTAWADADLFAALLSHGIIVGLIVLWLYTYGGSGRRLAPAAR